MSLVADRLAGSAELALRANGFDGQRLLKLAYGVANTYARKTGSGLDSRLDDLAQHLALTACRRAILYDPDLNPNSTFSSYLWDVMEFACVDWHRRKAEGFGDRRYGHDNRVTLAGDEQDVLAVEMIQFTDDIASRDQIEHWLAAAEVRGLTVQDWIVYTLNAEADRLADRPRKRSREVSWDEPDGYRYAA